MGSRTYLTQPQHPLGCVPHRDDTFVLLSQRNERGYIKLFLTVKGKKEITLSKSGLSVVISDGDKEGDDRVICMYLFVLLISYNRMRLEYANNHRVSLHNHSQRMLLVVILFALSGNIICS